MNRHERKYYLANEDYSFVKALILNHPAQFREIYNKRVVNNIYFDMPGFDFFYDNVNGNQIRKKIRIRWYDETFSHQKKLTLEYKLKNGLAGTKISYPLTDIYTGAGFEITQIRNDLKSEELPLNVYNELLACYPVLLNRYVREYFVSDDNKCRLTLDRELSYFRIHSGKNYFNVCYNALDDVVLEMKYNPADEPVADSISQKFPFRVTKSSKYVSGVQCLYAII